MAKVLRIHEFLEYKNLPITPLTVIGKTPSESNSQH